MPRHNPVGVYEDLTAPGGVAPSAGATLPGAMTTGVGDAGAVATADSRSRSTTDGAPSLSVIASFTLDGEMYRIRHLASRLGPAADEVHVAPDQAVDILSKAATLHEENRELVHLLQLAASQLVGLHEPCVYLLLRLRVYDRPSSPPPAAAGPASTPSALRPPPPPEPSSLVEEPVMEAAQAMALKVAAAAGVPFCEECARLAARQPAATT
jgi:hypothetical protein